MHSPWLLRLAGLFLLTAILSGVPMVFYQAPACAYTPPPVGDPACAYCGRTSCHGECQNSTSDYDREAAAAARAEAAAERKAEKQQRTAAAAKRKEEKRLAAAAARLNQRIREDKAARIKEEARLLQLMAENELKLERQKQFTRQQAWLLQLLKGNKPSAIVPTAVTSQNLQRASAFARAVESAAAEDVPALLDEALKIANGTGSTPASGQGNDKLPKIDEKSLLAFQLANIEYAIAMDFRVKCIDNLKNVQQRRELACQAAKIRRVELATELAVMTDDTSRKRIQELLAEIDAALLAEDDTLAQARIELDVAEDLADKTNEESVRILRALALGKDPASFHPPIARLPALTDKVWRKMDKSITMASETHEGEVSNIQKTLAFAVPPLKSPERIHEGVILGAFSDKDDVDDMERDGFSPLMQQSYAERNISAEQARKDGKEIGGAMVVSFGTPELKSKYDRFVNEGFRVVLDHMTRGEFSLITPQARTVIEKLAGKEFDRLIAHSNGASVAEALINNDIIKVHELNVVGGDMSLMNRNAYQQLVDSGKVERVVVWINLNDPVPGLTSLLRFMDPEDCTEEAAELLAKKVTGDSRVTYRFMHGVDYRDTAAIANDSGIIKKKFKAIFAAHRIETSYFGSMAIRLGYKPVIPERVRMDK